MFGLIRKLPVKIQGRTVYMEVYCENKITYRVVSGYINGNCETFTTYGVEIEDRKNGETEAINDFSRDIEDAVDFAEMLVSQRSKPCEIYSRALKYLYVSICS